MSLEHSTGPVARILARCERSHPSHHDSSLVQPPHSCNSLPQIYLLRKPFNLVRRIGARHPFSPDAVEDGHGLLSDPMRRVPAMAEIDELQDPLSRSQPCTGSPQARCTIGLRTSLSRCVPSQEDRPITRLNPRHPGRHPHHLSGRPATRHPWSGTQRWEDHTQPVLFGPCRPPQTKSPMHTAELPHVSLTSTPRS